MKSFIVVAAGVGAVMAVGFLGVPSSGQRKLIVLAPQHSLHWQQLVGGHVSEEDRLASRAN